ncbi:hypothetical protein GUITHDRAFT_146111 [Guillardia theta CCMP2712]|uniref:Uncharacterized protein n=1 Tax=Guillardia theta (strain CCMP2712) TaxID=905079 RepID=L1IJG7_GUITC|nr:hypothetical protein GUITHDRAFT_146111 [Guillardia theta CCMP2712]EKX35955.1 hypothetical protein GUITHDRAFT_146111 [Guillardia theta CCMP2712]|eukprot:XP_005822935.1 hypothetical protein GUITHDRAFT_146111 [Guillardia theta CCMP2712]
MPPWSVEDERAQDMLVLSNIAMELEASAPQRHNASQILLKLLEDGKGEAIGASSSLAHALNQMLCDKSGMKAHKVSSELALRLLIKIFVWSKAKICEEELLVNTLEDKVEQFRHSNAATHAGMACLAHSLLLACNKLSLGTAASYRQDLLLSSLPRHNASSACSYWQISTVLDLLSNAIFLREDSKSLGVAVCEVLSGLFVMAHNPDNRACIMEGKEIFERIIHGWKQFVVPLWMPTAVSLEGQEIFCNSDLDITRHCGECFLCHCSSFRREGEEEQDQEGEETRDTETWVRREESLPRTFAKIVRRMGRELGMEEGKFVMDISEEALKQLEHELHQHVTDAKRVKENYERMLEISQNRYLTLRARFKRNSHNVQAASFDLFLLSVRKSKLERQRLKRAIQTWRHVGMSGVESCFDDWKNAVRMERVLRESEEHRSGRLTAEESLARHQTSVSNMLAKIDNLEHELRLSRAKTEELEEVLREREEEGEENCAMCEERRMENESLLDQLSALQEERDAAEEKMRVKEETFCTSARSCGMLSGALLSSRRGKRIEIEPIGGGAGDSDSVFSMRSSSAIAPSEVAGISHKLLVDNNIISILVAEIVQLLPPSLDLYSPIAFLPEQQIKVMKKKISNLSKEIERSAPSRSPAPLPCSSFSVSYPLLVVVVVVVVVLLMVNLILQLVQDAKKILSREARSLLQYYNRAEKLDPSAPPTSTVSLRPAPPPPQASHLIELVELELEPNWESCADKNVSCSILAADVAACLGIPRQTVADEKSSLRTQTCVRAVSRVTSLLKDVKSLAPNRARLVSSLASMKALHASAPVSDNSTQLTDLSFHMLEARCETLSTVLHELVKVLVQKMRKDVRKSTVRSEEASKRKLVEMEEDEDDDVDEDEDEVEVENVRVVKQQLAPSCNQSPPVPRGLTA